MGMARLLTEWHSYALVCHGNIGAVGILRTPTVSAIILSPKRGHMRKKSLAGCLAAAGVAAALTLTGAPMAQAAAPSAGLHATVVAGSHTPSAIGAASRTFTIPAGTATFSSAGHGTHVTVTKTPAQVPQTVTCTLTVNTPFRYYGGPYGGGEEALAQVQCTGAVYEIAVEVDLFKNGVDVAYNVKTVYSSYLAGVDTEYPVSPGTYQAGAISDVYWSNSTSYSVLGPVYSPTVSL
jgi:hypothetical protein